MILSEIENWSYCSFVFSMHVFNCIPKFMRGLKQNVRRVITIFLFKGLNGYEYLINFMSSVNCLDTVGSNEVKFCKHKLKHLLITD